MKIHTKNMKVMTINSLEQLKQWNQNPTKEKPYVADWFYDWFFDEVIMKNKKELALDSYSTMITFTSICENLSKEDATERMDSNLGYYAGYSQKWTDKLNKILPHIKHPILSN